MIIPTYTIKSVRWKERTIGIGEWRVPPQGIYILIDQRVKSGELLYPNKYFCSYALARKGEVEIIKGAKLRIVNIDDMEIISPRT